MQKTFGHTLIIDCDDYGQYKIILDDLIHVIFHRALASSVDVKDGTLTSRAVPLFWGQQLITYLAHTKKHGKTSLLDRSVTSRTASVLYLSLFSLPSLLPSACLSVSVFFTLSFSLSPSLSPSSSLPHNASLLGLITPDDFR